MINKGYNYPKEFKDIHNVDEILEIFERPEK